MTFFLLVNVDLTILNNNKNNIDDGDDVDNDNDFNGEIIHHILGLLGYYII